MRIFDLSDYDAHDECHDKACRDAGEQPHHEHLARMGFSIPAQLHDGLVTGGDHLSGIAAVGSPFGPLNRGVWLYVVIRYIHFGYPPYLGVIESP